MNLVLRRGSPQVTCTPGSLYLNGNWQCYTLEDLPRPSKVPGETRIPAGNYRVTLTPSPRFKRVLPLINDVPEFSGVRIHPGNTDRDTAGCILVGQGFKNEALTSSRVAFDQLFSRLEAASARGEPINLLIEDDDE